MLVVVAIIMVLAAMVFVFAKRGIDRARAVQCLGQMRDLKIGMQAFITDYQKPPVPASKRYEVDGRVIAWDTMYGDPGGLYGNEFIVAVLAGDDADYPTNTGEVFSARQANPRGETYLQLPVVDDNKSGVGREDGRLYDPWGRQMMIAVNAPPYQSFIGDPAGTSDEILMTWGFAEYQDTKPRDQQFVMWSYGKDGKKAASSKNGDDVISW
jgi:type II secretory pathway pseudopilin PulG